MATLWSRFLTLLDTKLTKSTTFHPETDGQTKVVNRMIVHILRMYNSKDPWTRDESIPYVKHIYNISLHSSIGRSSFQVGLGFPPLCLIDVVMPRAATQTKYTHVLYEADKEDIFIKCIQHIHQQFHDILEKSNAKYKKWHAQHRAPHMV